VSPEERVAGACLVACGMFVAGYAQTAGLADLPKRKPGLWELGVVAASGQQAQVTGRICIDAITDAALTSFAVGLSSQVCSKRDVRVTGSVATIDAVCKISDSVQTSHSKITFTGNTAYRAEIRVHSDPPFMGRSDTTTTQVGKWTGACPADIKPGDLVMGNGVKINVMDMAGFKAP
jgi:Protein of unknown function (DUF3617)